MFYLQAHQPLEFKTPIFKYVLDLLLFSPLYSAPTFTQTMLSMLHLFLHGSAQFCRSVSQSKLEATNSTTLGSSHADIFTDCYNWLLSSFSASTLTFHHFQSQDNFYAIASDFFNPKDSVVLLLY